MGGICCKDTRAKGESPHDEKAQAPAQQGTNTERAVAPEKAPEQIDIQKVPDHEPDARRAPKDGGQLQAPLGTGPAAATAALSTGDRAAIDPEQVVVSEVAAPAVPGVQKASTSATIGAAHQLPSVPETCPADEPPILAESVAPSDVGDAKVVPQVAPSTVPPVVAQPLPAIGQRPVAASASQHDLEANVEAARYSAPPFDTMSAGASTTPFLSVVHEMSEARASHAGNPPPSAEQGRVKVETTRRVPNAGGGGDGSSSVSYSHSTASSQQQGSSHAAGSMGQGLSPMLGSSAAPAMVAEGEAPAAPRPAPSADAGSAAAAEAAVDEGSNPPSESTQSSTPAPKASNAGFMFGAPRVKEHKDKRRKDPKRTKSQSSGSTQSGVAPPTASDTITGSKTSAAPSEPTSAAHGAGGTLGGSTIAGSSAAVPVAGSSFAAPSTGSSTAPTSSAVFRPIGPQGSSNLGPAGGGSIGDGTVGSCTDYRSIGRRVKTVKNSADGGSSGRASSRTRESSAAVSAAGGDGTLGGASAGAAGGVGTGGIMEEALPEGDAEGEATDHSESTEQSSSEHLSIMSPPEGSDVENVLQLICNIFQLPVALVAAYRSANIFIRSTALRLTDDDQWRYSLAQWSMLNASELRDVLIVPDAREDERFRNYYCVKNEPKVKFFLASPLRSSTGELLGTLCMADFEVRTMELTNLLVVNNLQTLVIKQLERDMSLAQERLENEAATEKLQQEMMRALDHFEKCIMFVDTSKPGWEVLYTNMAWEHVTGIPREHVLGRALERTAAGDPSRVPRVHVMGRPLQDFFMALGGAALDWSSTLADVASRAEFTVHRVAVRQKPDKLVSLHLRLATAEASGDLDGLLPKGLPTWVKQRGNEAHNYFVFVEEATGGSTVYEALAKHVEKVPGLELSHLLGKGGFGSVYYGTWNGMPVAVKMIDNKLTKTNTEGISLEALMGQELAHPNIVKTIKYVMRSARGASSVSGSNSRGMNSNARNTAAMHSRHSGLGHMGHGVGSHHGSRNPALPGAGSGGVNGAGGATIPTSNAPGLAPYMTSAQPGLSGMTSAQMAAALDLTSASGMQHLQRQGTTTNSDATTVAGGGSSYSGQVGPAGDPSGRSVPPRVGNLIGSTPPTPHGAEALTNATTSTHTSGVTAVGPASVQASSTSTAAGPPSIASASGAPANTALSSDMSRTHSANNLAAAAAAAAAAGTQHASATIPAISRLAGTTTGGAGPSGSGQSPLANPRGSAGGGPFTGPRSGSSFRGAPGVAGGPPVPAAAPLPSDLPPLVAPANAPGHATSITAAVPPGAPAPHVPAQLTPEQQAAMTSRFSLAFSTITSGGDVLVPGKGSRSPSSSSGGCGMTQQNAMASAGSGEDMGEVWIIMEFCDRGSLQDALDRGALKLRKPSGELGETHLPMMVATACEVASALHYLHGKGIVHGDLTAWNVMICTAQGGQQDRSGRNFVAKVADFGLSRTLDLRSKIKTRTYGTISHMPPECLISGIISKATDVFAFGVLLWQMYTGLRPWAGMNHGQIIYNVGMKNVQLLFPPGTPPAIADLSSSCTRTEPTQRPSFGEILDKLDKIRASLGL